MTRSEPTSSPPDESLEEPTNIPTNESTNEAMNLSEDQFANQHANQFTHSPSNSPPNQPPRKYFNQPHTQSLETTEANYWANEPRVLEWHHWYWQCHKCGLCNPMALSAHDFNSIHPDQRQYCGNRNTARSLDMNVTLAMTDAERIEAGVVSSRGTVGTGDPTGGLACVHQRCPDCFDVDDGPRVVRWCSGEVLDEERYAEWLRQGGFVPPFMQELEGYQEWMLSYQG